MRFHVFKNPSTITSSVVGAAFNPTLDATKGLESADDEDGPWLLHRTGAVVPALPPRRGGVASPYDVVQRRWNNGSTPVHFEFAVKTDGGTFIAPNNKFQYWIGLFSASPDGFEFPPLSLQMVAFRFRPQASDVWQAFGSNGLGFTPATLSGSPITVQSSTKYLLEIDLQGTTAVFRIDGQSYATLGSGDKLPDASQLLGYGVRVFAYEDNGEDRTIRWKRISWDHV